jgi:hypothetical protein
MYCTTDLIQCIKQACDGHDINEDPKAQIMNISILCIKQNYFRYQDMTHIQNKRLVMGVHTSCLFSEIYLQHIENNKIANILLNHHIVGYCHCADILIGYKHSLNDIQDVLTCFNSTMTNMKFPLDEKTDHKINYFRYHHFQN